MPLQTVIQPGVAENDCGCKMTAENNCPETFCQEGVSLEGVGLLVFAEVGSSSVRCACLISSLLKKVGSWLVEFKPGSLWQADWNMGQMRQ